MHSLPDELSHLFNVALDKGQYPENIKYLYRKWLRYYWDFCQKYHHDPHRRSSLPLFLKKLEQKNQTEQQCEQAHRALVLFYKTQVKAGTDDAKSQHPILALTKRSPPKPNIPIRELAPEPSHSIPNSVHRSAPHDKTQQSFPDANIQQKSDQKRQTGCSWVAVFDGLTREIKSNYAIIHRRP
ncbi:hypothetical protein [Methylomonas methanica]|uniref:hypothetical protein n=1 Tax=Methylomonas methanica TaxID=421 RepID=UPI000674C9AD|nr:hypothetical protein [Methylomonas methanica]